MKNLYRAVVIGASAGGLEALSLIIPCLPVNFIPVIVVMHLKSDSGNFLAPYLNEKSQLKVKEAESHETIERGMVYIAPPAYHLLIEQDYTFSLSVEEPVNFSRPSIDVLFESAAYAYQDGLIGVILTGANEDGSAGFKMIKEHGGLLIAQDPVSAAAPRMPIASIQHNDIDYIVSLDRIASFLIELVS